MLGFVAPFQGSPIASRGKTFAPHTCSRRRRPANVGRVSPACIWVERSATVLIEMDPLEAYGYYIDLEAMPDWSPWLKRVEVDKVEHDVSRWVLASQGIEISWKARNTRVIPGEIIAWKSESGLTNRGRVTFVKDGEEKTLVTLAIEFDVPSAIAKVIDNNFIGRFVEDTLLADMKRFRTVALTKRRRRLRAEVSAAKE